MSRVNPILIALFTVVVFSACGGGTQPGTGADVAQASSQHGEDKKGSSSTCKEADPVLKLKPPSAVIGDPVRMRGRCFVDRFWQQMKSSTGYGISLLAHVNDAGKPVRDESRVTCELVAGTDGTFDIDQDGRLSGHFKVPADGACFQQEETRALGPGRYQVLIGCHTCQLAVLRVRDQ